MEDVKKALNQLWKALVKLVLSKTTLDEKVAEKVGKLNENVKAVDELDSEDENKK